MSTKKPAPATKLAPRKPTPTLAGRKGKLVIVVVITAVGLIIAALYILYAGPGEQGTSFSTAIPLTGTAYGTVSIITNDKYYTFQVDTGHRAIVSLICGGGEALGNGSPKIELTLYDSNQSKIGWNPNIPEGYGRSLIAAGSMGYYYAKIHTGNLNVSYSISINYVIAPSAAPLGGSFSDAITLYDGLTGHVASNQSVYYKFWVDAGQNFSVGADTVSGKQNIIVYDSNQSQIDSYVEYIGRHSGQVATSSGYYYVEVWGRETGSYIMSLYVG